MGTPLKTGKVIIACFVTSYAQLELFHLLHKLQDRVLYSDSDCIVYTTGTHQWKIKTGPYVGQLTNKLNEDK